MKISACAAITRERAACNSASVTKNSAFLPAWLLKALCWNCQCWRWGGGEASVPSSCSPSTVVLIHRHLAICFQAVGHELSSFLRESQNYHEFDHPGNEKQSLAILGFWKQSPRGFPSSETYSVFETCVEKKATGKSSPSVRCQEDVFLKEIFLNGEGIFSCLCGSGI